MTKPRNSVLYMFDPLHQSPSTPRRDSSSPELGPSDKENDVPAGDITIFFNRTYAVHKQQEVQVFTPKGKLIDIGDTPVAERVWDAMEHDGSDADGEQSESDAEGCGIVSSPRVPFAELDVERTPRPQLSNRPIKAPLFTIATSSLHESRPIPTMLVPAPQASPLAEVINSINFSSLTLSEETTVIAAHPPTLEVDELDNTRLSSPFPEINVCAPETPSVEEFNIPKDNERPDSPMANATHLRPPSTLTQLSPDDPRRTSVDLYSSFHLQMQSADMSFDLLNDKISFLGNGQDSYWAGGDDALDFEEMSLPQALKSKVDKLVSFAQSMEYAPSPPHTAIQSLEIPPVMSPTTERAVNIPLPLSPIYSAPPSRDITPKRSSQPVVDEPPSPSTSPVVADEPSLLLESEPLPPPIPAAVPALRIVKKTFKRQDPMPQLSKPVMDRRAEKQETILKKRSSLVLGKPPAVPSATTQRPAIQGVQRPPTSMHRAGSVVIGLPPQGSFSTSSSTSASSSGTSANMRATRAAEAAAPVSRFAGIQRPNLAAKEKAAPRSASGVVRPIAGTLSGVKATAGLTRVVSAGVLKPSAGASALRPPSRIAAMGGSSALPKPASRLPGPSGLARTASMSSGLAGRNTGAVPTRERSSTLSRATGRF